MAAATRSCHCSTGRAEPLASVGVTQVALSSLVAGFDWPGPDPRTHLVLATVEGRGRLLVGERQHDLVPGTVAVCPAHTSPATSGQTSPGDSSPFDSRRSSRGADSWQMGPFVLDGQDPHRFAAPVLGMVGELPLSDDRRLGGLARSRSDGRVPQPLRAQLNLEPSDTGPTPPTEPFSLYAVILRIQLEALLAGPPSVSDDERRLAGCGRPCGETRPRLDVESLAPTSASPERRCTASSPATTKRVPAPSSSASGWTTPPPARARRAPR